VQELRVSHTIPREGAPAIRRRGNSRATVRYSCAPATIGRLYVGDDAEHQYACVLNISEGGIGLVLPRPIAAGTSVIIQVRTVETRVADDLPARVMHCTAQVSGEWLVGCEFAEALAPDALDALLV
jgi:hypothetical protein